MECNSKEFVRHSFVLYRISQCIFPLDCAVVSPVPQSWLKINYRSIAVIKCHFSRPDNATNGHGLITRILGAGTAQSSLCDSVINCGDQAPRGCVRLLCCSVSTGRGKFTDTTFTNRPDTQTHTVRHPPPTHPRVIALHVTATIYFNENSPEILSLSLCLASFLCQTHANRMVFVRKLGWGVFIKLWQLQSRRPMR